MIIFTIVAIISTIITITATLCYFHYKAKKEAYLLEICQLKNDIAVAQQFLQNKGNTIDKLKQKLATIRLQFAEATNSFETVDAMLKLTNERNN